MVHTKILQPGFARGRGFKALAFCALLMLVGNALAANNEYYRAQVPVSSQSAQDRSRAAGIGLKQVLIRVSGHPDVASAPGILAELNNANRYLELFDYGRTTTAEGAPQQVLNLQFSAPLVDRLLYEKGQPFWPLNRPKTLVWLAEDAPDNGRRIVVDPEHPALKAIVEAARARGVPLIYPLLDLDDRLAVNVDQVWDLNDEAIINASERYAVETMLVGRLVQSSSGAWLATWEYIHQGQTRVYDARGEDLSNVAEAGINPLADYLAGLYAVTPNAEGSAALLAKINGVTSYKAYDKLVAYLTKQAIVTKFSVININGDEVWLKLQLSGSLKQMQNAFALDGIIGTESLAEYDSTPWRLASVGTQATPLHLYWQGAH